MHTRAKAQRKPLETWQRFAPLRKSSPGRRSIMSEEELQLLITLDDPVDAPEEDIFNHLQAENTFEYWLSLHSHPLEESGDY
jgi:hypothetical protein